MTETTDFLPPDYEAPKGENNYMKFEDGTNRFRIMNSPIIGWLDWKDNKPLRYKNDSKPSQPIDPSKPIKHFWAMPVWNYQEEKVQILEITQQTIYGKIQNLAKSDDWGDPREYDIEVTKTGDGLGTKYEVIAIPPKPISVKIADAYNSIIIDLEQLWAGGDPFKDNKE